MASTTIKSFIIGDTFIVDLELKVSGVAENLEGATLWATCKKKLTDADDDALFQHYEAVPNGVDAQNGLARLTVPSDLTRIAPGTVWLEIQRTFPGTPPDVWTIFRRQVEALQDVTVDDAP
jgi:hypothetical protein